MIATTGRRGSAWRRPLELPPRRARRIVFALLALPFVVAAIVLSTRRWVPVLDLAMTELRVRDVFGRHTPLIGLPGRIGVGPGIDLRLQGSHPGPLSFYILAPIYRLAGSSPWSMQLATIVLHLVAIWAALWIAERRGGTRVILATGALLAVLVHGYGLGVLTQPWNPYLPLLAWVVVLLATWSVLLGDHAMLVVVAAAGSLCAQTHLPYLGLAIGMGAGGVAWIVVEAVRHPTQRGAARDQIARALAVAVVLWIPVAVDEVRRTPGNLTKLREYFGDPPEEPVGLAAGVRLLLRHLDVVRLGRGLVGVAGREGGAFVERGGHLDGSVVPGAIVLVVWLGAVALAWRIRHRPLLALDAVIAAALVLATISMSRIFGKVWFYLTLWAWPVVLLFVGSVAWTLFAWASARQPQRTAVAGRARPAIAALVAIVAAVAYLPALVDSARAQVPEAHLSTTLRALVGPTARALEDGVGAAEGKGGRYVVLFSDAMWFGSQAYGLVSELERRGFEVGMADPFRVPITPQRVVDEAAATAEIRLATGVFVDRWREVPGAEEVAHVDPRDDAELDEYDRLDAELRDRLTELDLTDLLPLVDSNLFGVQVDARVPPDLQAIVDRMLHLGQQEAVFIVPPGTPPPS